MQDVEFSFLDGKLHVLHVFIVLLQPSHKAGQLFVSLWHYIVEFLQFYRRADAGHDVFALGIHQELAVEFLFACARITRKADACAAVITHVAEYHRLNIDGRAQQAGDVVKLAILNSTRRHPRLNHCID